MKGLQIWVSTLIEYDAYGNAKVLKSFTKIAKYSGVNKKEKEKSLKTQTRIKTDGKKEELW